MSSPNLPMLFLFFFDITVSMAAPTQLKHGFYAETCPKAGTIVRHVMKTIMLRDTRHAAYIMRLQFHDCFVNGCDGSVLLDDTPTMSGEKFALANAKSLNYEAVDQIKLALENACPGVVSCADIIIMASRDAVALSGGPDWEVKLGRKDSLTASVEDSNEIMPSPRANATLLIQIFEKFNLTVRDMVALSGSHSIGKGMCKSVLFRLYNQSGTGRPDRTIERRYRKKLNKLCPRDVDDTVWGDLDATPKDFDNRYFRDLIAGRGFLTSDQTLYSMGHPTRERVVYYSKHKGAFFKDFVKGMVKLGDLLSGRPGEVRKNCRVANSPNVQGY